MNTVIIKMLRLVITAVVLVVSVQAHGKSKCPFALGKYPFDASKFAGEWNLIAGTPFQEEKVCKCGRALVTVEKKGDDESLAARFTARNAQDDKPLAYEIMTHCLIPKSGVVLSVYRKEGTDKWSDVYKKSILATDYTSYALSLSCKQKFDEKTKEFGRHAIAEIWSRNETLSQDVLDVLVSVASGYDIDPSTIHKVDRNNCN